MQHNCRCYSILFFILSLVLFISPSPLSLHYPSTPLTIVSFVCVYVWVGWRDGSLLWLLLFGRYLAKVLFLFSSLTLDSNFLLFSLHSLVPFSLFFSPLWNCNTMREEVSKATKRFPNIWLLFIWSPYNSSYGYFEKGTCWWGWTFDFVWLLN